LIYYWFVSRIEKREEFDTMLHAPLAEARPERASTNSRVSRAPSLSDEDEGASFMAFLGEHSSFKAQTGGRG
jgi:hypothetical protein